MSTPENATTAPKPKFDPAKIDAAIKRAQEQAGTVPAAKAEKKKTEKTEKTAKEKAPKTERVVKEKPAKAPAHLSKVEKAASGLPAMTPGASQFVIEIGKGLDQGLITVGDLVTIAAHLTYKARLAMTAGAVGAKLTVGSLVEILPGDKGAEKHVGRMGRLTEVRSIRCFADILADDGVTVIKKGLYLFTSGVKVVQAASPANPKPTLDSEQEDESDEEIEIEAKDESAEEVKEFPADADSTAEQASNSNADSTADSAEEGATGTEG